MTKPLRPAGPAPNEGRLREAAIRHLARFSATEAGLRQVLLRRIDRWAQRAASEGLDPETLAASRAAAREAASLVAKAMVSLGAVDDAAFAASRARRLNRSGRSQRAIAAHLGAKGIAPATAAAAMPAPDSDLAAALMLCRRRRMGPFGGTPAPEERNKALAALARAGFPRSIAEAALDMALEDAEMRLIALRQG